MLPPGRGERLSHGAPVPGLGAPPPSSTLSRGLEGRPDPSCRAPCPAPTGGVLAGTPAAPDHRTGSPAAGLWGDPTRPARPPTYLPTPSDPSLGPEPPRARGFPPTPPGPSPAPFHKHLAARPPPTSPGPSPARDTRQHPWVPCTPPGSQHPPGIQQSGSPQGPGPARDVSHPSPPRYARGLTCTHCTPPAQLPDGYFRR